MKLSYKLLKIILIFLAIIYSGLWYFGCKVLSDNLDKNFDIISEKYNMEIGYTAINVKGFPFKYKIVISDLFLKMNNSTGQAKAKDFEISFYPLAKSMNFSSPDIFFAKAFSISNVGFPKYEIFGINYKARFEDYIFKTLFEQPEKKDVAFKIIGLDITHNGFKAVDSKSDVVYELDPGGKTSLFYNADEDKVLIKSKDSLMFYKGLLKAEAPIALSFIGSFSVAKYKFTIDDLSLISRTFDIFVKGESSLDEKTKKEGFELNIKVNNYHKLVDIASENFGVNRTDLDDLINKSSNIKGNNLTLRIYQNPGEMSMFGNVGFMDAMNIIYSGKK